MNHINSTLILMALVTFVGCKDKQDTEAPVEEPGAGESTSAGDEQEEAASKIADSPLAKALAAFDQEAGDGDPRELVSNIGGVKKKEASVYVAEIEWGIRYKAHKEKFKMVLQTLKAIEAAEKEGQFHQAAGFHGMLVEDTFALATLFNDEMTAQFDRVMEAIDSGNFGVSLDEKLSAKLGAYNMLYLGLAMHYARRSCVYLEHGDEKIKKVVAKGLISYLEATKENHEARMQREAERDKKLKKGKKGKASGPKPLPVSRAFEAQIHGCLGQHGDLDKLPVFKERHEALEVFVRGDEIAGSEQK